MLLNQQPYLDINVHLVESEDIYLTLNNHGVGPALISSVKFITDKEDFHIKGYEDYKIIFKTLGLDLNDVGHKVVVLPAPSPLAQGCETSLISFPGSGENPAIHREIEEVLSSLTIKIVYECIYEKSFNLEFKL